VPDGGSYLSDHLVFSFSRAIWRAWSFDACEVLGIVSATGTNPAGDLWIAADRATAIDAVIGYMGRNDEVRSNPLLDPQHESTQYVV
jgi:hypothetical protein